MECLLQTLVRLKEFPISAFLPARLMAQIPKEEQTANAENKEQPTVRGGAFAQASEAETPFGFGRVGIYFFCFNFIK